IPTTETDPQFQSWLKSLNVPKGSMTPEPPQLPIRGRPTDESSDFAATREKGYVRFFGDRLKVDQGEAEDGSAVDVYIFKPGQDASGGDRELSTLGTSG